MSNAFKAMSLLLSYPTQEITEAADEIWGAVASEVAGPIWALDRVGRLIEDYKSLDLYELQERYVFLFDRTRSLSLHLFEHVHGESRDRGQAMVDLKALYAEAGLEVDARELPDFLPLFLEYLSLRPEGEARALLAEPIAVIAALKERLQKRKSNYAGVFAVLEAIAAAAPGADDLAELRQAPDDDPNDLEALDRAWAEEPVEFGPGAAPCPTVSRMLDRMSPAGAAGETGR